MLQLQVLRTQKELVLAGLKKKHFHDLGLPDQIIAIDEERRKVQSENDDILSKINAASKEIGKLMAQGQKDEAEALKAQVPAWKEAVSYLLIN
jgi:seryl-tRNA synthetase